jgi:hypothetical protein
MKRLLYILFTFIFLLTLLGAPTNKVQAGSAWFVSQAGTADDACTAEDPCSLQHAAASAANSDTIYIQTGNYRVSSGNEVLYIDKSLQIIGGCGAAWVCNPDTTPSTLIDGQNSRRGITIQGTGVENIFLYNLTISYGKAQGIDTTSCPTDLNPIGITTSGCGAGLFANNLHWLTVSNNHIKSNDATLTSGTAGYGGAVYLENIDHLTFDYNEISHNSASVNGLGFGGGLFVKDISENGQIDFNIFHQNDCTMVNADSLGCHAFFNSSYYLLFNKNTFTNGNSQPTLNIKGSALYFRMNGQFHLANNYFEGNQGSSVITSTRDTAIAWDKIDSNKFWNNSTLTIVQITGYNPTNIKNNFFGHAEPSRQDALDRAGMSVAVSVSNMNSTVDINFNTFAKLDRGISASEVSGMTVKNNIFAYITAEAIFTSGSVTKTIDRNLFYGFVGGWTGTNALIGIYNPLLVDPAHGDFHIGSNSAAIDMALDPLDVTRDIDNQLRSFGASDLGADEYVSVTFMPFVVR